MASFVGGYSLLGSKWQRQQYAIAMTTLSIEVNIDAGKRDLTSALVTFSPKSPEPWIATRCASRPLGADCDEKPNPRAIHSGE
jgi:hypothetical protein